MPLLFQGEEYAETAPFDYFTSHGDPALIEAVRAGRRAEFASFAWQGEVPDPQAPETFVRSRLDRGRACAPLLRLYRDLHQFFIAELPDGPEPRPSPSWWARGVGWIRNLFTGE